MNGIRPRVSKLRSTRSAARGSQTRHIIRHSTVVLNTLRLIPRQLDNVVVKAGGQLLALSIAAQVSVSQYNYKSCQRDIHQVVNLDLLRPVTQSGRILAIGKNLLVTRIPAENK